MPDLFVTRRLPLDAVAFVAARDPALEVAVFAPERAATPEEIQAAAAGARALVPLVSDPVDVSLLEALPHLEVVANFGVGTDNVDIEACTRRGVQVTNTPDVLTDATADLTWALLLAAARRMPEGMATIAEGRFSGWSPTMLLGQGLRGARLGVFGFGRIGQAVGRRALGFGMEVAYVRRSEATVDWATRVSLETLVRTSDALVLCAPLSAETRHVIGAPELRAMKPSAVLVNTARGPLVDEAALGDALRERRILAAGLDVFEREPEVHPSLLGLPNAVLLPHLGSATVQARRAMAELALGDAVRVLRGEAPRHPVNEPKRAG